MQISETLQTFTSVIKKMAQEQIIDSVNDYVEVDNLVVEIDSAVDVYFEIVFTYSVEAIVN